MAQNVFVCCRFRPANQREFNEGAEIVTSVDLSCKTVAVKVDNPSLLLDDNEKGISANKQTNPSFNFDYVFSPEVAQQNVYENTAKPLVKDVFEGYNTTIFAYGQTGSGKTHTMMGKGREADKGIIPRLVEDIFSGIEAANDNMEFTVKLSYIEIYNERIRDLLNPKSSDNLKIREGSRGVYIEGVTETYVGSYDQVIEVMSTGTSNRAIASTNMNSESSRSHSVFLMTLGQVDSSTGSKKGSKLILVDLAGSEKVEKTGAFGQTLNEAKHINKSLSALGNVINALSSSAPFIPYRDSKLTRLLSDSLGGNSKTCLIITCSPMSTNVDETLSTLRFGTRAKLIKNKPKMNQERSILEYKKLLTQSEAKIKIQEEIIIALETDIAELQKCIQAVDAAHLVLPIPDLQSKELLERADWRSGEQTSNGQLEKLPDLKPLSLGDTVITPSTVAEPSPSAASVAESFSSIAPPSDHAPSSIESISSPISESGDVSSSPIVAPASPPSANPSSRKTSTVDALTMRQRLTTLTMLNNELEEKLTLLHSEKEKLLDIVEEKSKEYEEILSEKDNYHKLFDTANSARLEHEEKLRLMDSIQSELKLLKNKNDLLIKQHELEINQLKEESSIKLAEVMNELNEQYNQHDFMAQANTQQQTKLINNVNSPKMQRYNSNTSTYFPLTVDTTSPQQQQTITTMYSSSPSSSITRSDSLTQPALLPNTFHTLSNENKITQLTIALQRKCDQYIELQLAHNNTIEHITMLESLLAESNSRLRIAQDNERLKNLEDKLTKQEEINQKLIQIGKFPDNELKKLGITKQQDIHNLTEQRNQNTNTLNNKGHKIVMPVAGLESSSNKKDDMSMFF